jgi:anti-sigma B factor antagonist
MPEYSLAARPAVSRIGAPCRGGRLHQVFWSIGAYSVISLTVTTRKCDPDITIIELSGRVTLGRESGQVDAAVAKAIESGVRKLVLDLKNVSYIDSTGIGIVALCFNRISKAAGQARVAGAQGIVLDVFRITRLDSVIPFLPDAAAACASLRPVGPSA